MRILKNIGFALCLLLFCPLNAFTQDKNTHIVSATVQFRVNTDSFIQNANYRNYINNIIPSIANNAALVDHILLVGSTSPEGNFAANMRLAHKRADKIYSYISHIVPKEKIVRNNDHQLFLNKTGANESDYSNLRATYIEVHFTETKPTPVVDSKTDTLYIIKRDTVRYYTTNNYYYNTTVSDSVHNKPVFAVYNDLVSDMLFRVNIGAEVYFKNWSYFLEGSFSNWNLVGKAYNVDVWHTGFRKYFGGNYDKLFVELFANAGYFDTELFSDMGKIGIFYGGGLGIGYVFNLCPHWKIFPLVRFGVFEKVHYADYYYVEQGNINIIFGNYQNGRINGGENDGRPTTQEQTVVMTSKTINKHFLENSYKAHYIGPTYIGLIIKRDFCRNNKQKHNK